MERAAEQLLDALNASTTLDQVQDAFVTSVDGLIDVPAHAIYYLDPVSLAPLRVRTKGASDSFLTSYEDAGRAIDPVLERVALERHTVHSRALLDDHSWRGHPFYPVVAQGGFDSTMQAPIVVEGDRSPLIIANQGYQDVVAMIVQFSPDVLVRSAWYDRFYERFAKRSARWRRV